MEFSQILKSSLSLVAVTVITPISTYAIANKLDQEIGSAITLKTDNNKVTAVILVAPYLDLYDGKVSDIQAFGYNIERIADKNNKIIQLRFYSQITDELIGIRSF